MKDYCQDGVGDNTQFGVNRPRLKTTAGGVFQCRDNGDTAFVSVAGADPIVDDDFVTKRWGLANLGGGASLPPGLPHADSVVFLVDIGDPGSYAGSGTALVDIAGNGSNGTLDGGATVSNVAVQINAAGQKVSFDKNGILDNLFAGGATVMTFVQLDVAGPNATGPGRFASTENAGNTTGWAFFGTGVFGLDGVRPNLIRRSGGGTDGNWSSSGIGAALPQANSAAGGGYSYGSMAVTYDEDVLSNDPVFYVNGQDVGLGTNTNPSALGSDVGTEVTFGNRDTGADYIQGQQQVTLFWSRILTAEEILQVQNLFMPRLTRGGSGPGTVAVNSSDSAGGHHLLRVQGLEAPTIAAGNSSCINLQSETATGKGITGSGINRSAILSGLNNEINQGDENVIAGGENNKIFILSGNSCIVAGAFNIIESGNAFIGAGSSNSTGAFASSAFIGAGFQNRVTDGTSNGIIAGFSNEIGAGGSTTDYNAIGSGENNDIIRGSWNFIGGGRDHDVGAGGTITHYTFVGGGRDNNIGLTGAHSSSDYSGIASGQTSIIATSTHAFIGGGQGHSIASGSWGTIPGGQDNDILGAQHAYAAGRQAHVTHDGAYLWADSTAQDEHSDRANQHKDVATGGFAERTTVGYGGAVGNPGEAVERFNNHVNTTGASPAVVAIGVLGVDQHSQAFRITVQSQRDAGANFRSEEFLVLAYRTGGTVVVAATSLGSIIVGTGASMAYTFTNTGDTIEITLTQVGENWQNEWFFSRQEGGFTS